MAKGEIGLARVHPLILKIVGLDFFGQSDASALLRQIDQHTGAFLADHLQGHLELVAAVAAERGYKIARETRRMQTHQGLSGFCRVADHYGHRLLILVLNTVANDPAGAEAGGKIGFGDAEHQFFATPAIADKGLDTDNLKMKLVGQGKKFVPGGPLAGFAEDLDEHARGFQSGHAG